MIQSSKKSWATSAVVILSIAGAWMSADLLRDHDGGWQVLESGTSSLSPCAGKAPGSPACSEVVASRWGSFDLHFGQRRFLIPTSWLGLAYFSSIAVWFLSLGPVTQWTSWQRLVAIAIVSIGTLVSVMFIALMGLAIKEWCTKCLFIHGLNVGIMIAAICSLRSTKGKPTFVEPTLQPTERGFIALQTRLGMTAIILALIVSAGSWLYFDAILQARQYWRRHNVLDRLVDSLQSNADLVVHEYLAQPVNPALNDLNADDAAELAHDSKIPRLVVFNDYVGRDTVCFDTLLGGHIAKAFGGDIQVDIRQLPTSPNPDDLSRLLDEEQSTETNMTRSIRASLAAKTAGVLGDEQGFRFLHQLLFLHRERGKDWNYGELATLAGMDADRFIDTMEGPAVLDELKQDALLARSLGVTRAPAAFLNGRKVPDICLHSETFWKTVARMLVDGQIDPQLADSRSFSVASQEPVEYP